MRLSGWTGSQAKGSGKVGDRIWVGECELSSRDSVTALDGPVTDQVSARVLVKMHGAAAGYVTVPVQPLPQLPARVRVAAETQLAESLRHHESCSDGSAATNSDWVSRLACPRAFPSSPGTGVTVAIPTRDRPAQLRECLQSVLRATYEPLEVLVVDNAPTDDSTKDVVAEFTAADPRVRYARAPEPGVSHARNLGLAAARYDLVAFVDDDVLVDRGWLAALAAAFAADPQVVCVTGLVASRSLETVAERYFDARFPWGAVFEPRRFDMTENRDPSPGYPFLAGKFGTGANFAVRRSFAERIGGFDLLLGGGSPGKAGEELDLFVRIILAGGRLCYIPSSVVWHRSYYSSLGKQLYGYGHGLGAYIAKRLMTGEVSVAAMAAGIGRLGALALQSRRAAVQSQASVEGGKWLALIEARGLIAGALCYYRLGRRSVKRGAPGQLSTPKGHATPG